MEQPFRIDLPRAMWKKISGTLTVWLQAQLALGRYRKKSSINTENVIALIVQEVSHTRDNFYHAIGYLGRREDNIV